ncbi:MAG: hypothetical protein CMD16_00115 [Flavobacteriales bacterium]|nr:hypothetical protein [Flavobacteriales bacterium]|tara:strand:- start:7366 stop:8574 length:1209 start_codon:yes stop_codon:yes gene_type:complete
MAKIRPFKAIRPTRDKVHLVASRSYLTYSDETLKEKLENNPFTFLHIINPEYNKESKKKGVEKFKLVKHKFIEFLDQGILFQDKKAAFYLYQQKKGEHKFQGIIAATSVDDYRNNIIKKHENTLTKREQMFKDYLHTTGFNADPVLLAYKSSDKIRDLIKKTTNKRAEYDFTTTNKAQHKLWIIDNDNDSKLIIDSFAGINKIYIADGHHRSASSALLSKEKKSDPSKFFMSYLIDEKLLKITNFNRLVKNLNGFSTNEFLKKIAVNYSITEKGNRIHSPSKKDEVSMYLEGSWYSLISKQQTHNTTVDTLDPSILSQNILNPILNIKDERTDKNIAFLDATISLLEIKKKIDNNEFAAAFILKPIPMDALKKAADNNEIMPPKSTYIEPKLRSGLTIYPIT